MNEQGEAVTDRIRIKTPEVPTPPAVLAVLNQLAEQSGEFDRISCGFPGVVVEGEIVDTIERALVVLAPFLARPH